MQENKTEPYIFILIGILKIIITVYSVYFVGITVFNISLKEVSGKITNINQYEKNFEGKGGKINVKEINYQYTVDGANYFGKRVSNLLIFPDLDFYRDKKITVYYSALFPKYSVLFRADFKYIIYNIFPIILLGIILHIIRVKNNLYDSIIKNKEDKIFTDEFRETVENDDDEAIEMEDIFFEETGKGESAIKFLLLLKEHDGMILESLLKSEQIPYKIEYASVKLRSYKNSIFYILEKDYYDALTVLNEYMRNKTQDEKEEIFIYKRQYGN